MVEETIQTIKQAEKEAGEIAAQADARCEQILSQASGEAEKMKEKILQDAIATSRKSSFPIRNSTEQSAGSGPPHGFTTLMGLPARYARTLSTVQSMIR